MSVNLRSVAGEVEHFPWGVVNNLTKVSPFMLRRVGIALLLQIETDPLWGISSPLAPGEYESYFRQVRSALPEIDEIVITSIAVRHSSHLFANLTYGRLAQCRIFLMRGYVTQTRLNDKDTINSAPVVLSSGVNVDK